VGAAVSAVPFVIVAFALVAVNAFFVAAEFALVRVRVTRIEELVGTGVRRAVATREVLRHLDAYISACQLGITLTSLGLGWVGEPAFARLFEPMFAWTGAWSAAASHSAAIVSAFALITFLHVVLGELAPKTFAITHPESTALAVSWPLHAFKSVFWPLIALMNGTSNFIVRLAGLTPASEGSLAHSEAELRMILAVSEKSGVLSGTHARLLSKALDFPDRTVRQILIPRGDVIFLDLRHSYAENLVRARDYGHTRYPLCDGGIDHVIGVVNIKDLFPLAAPPATGGDLRAIARPPLFVPDTVRIEQALALFQKRRLHLGVVVDEYGGTAGVVTLEDVLEELIGEIQDEYDQESPKVQPQPDGRLLVDAALSLDDMDSLLGIADDGEEDVDTIAGLVLARLGRIARVGDAVRIGGRRVEVVKVRGRRIVRIAVSPPEIDASQAEP
jgi:CBS domain containing-hemolysin-like protein